MNDDKIVDLYWIRSEDAITETSIKYGKYCYGIAYNILADAEESVNDLPTAERRVFLCRYWYLDSISAICEQFGYSQSKVKVMLHRTRKALHNCLVSEEYVL